MSSFLNIPSDAKGVAIPGRDGEYVDPRTLSTTPGGTKIMYNRDTLLFLGNSPICRTPPSGMAMLPGVTSPATKAPKPSQEQSSPSPAAAAQEKTSGKEPEEDIFSMD